MRYLFAFLFFVNLIPQRSFSAAAASLHREDDPTIIKHLSTVTSTQEVLQSAMESYANGDQLPFHNLFGASADPTSGKAFALSASRQTAGIGSGTNRWASPEGNLYLSFVLGNPISLAKIAKTGHLVPQVAGLSVVEALVELGFPVKLLWPNHILIKKHKCGGILPSPVTYKHSYWFIIGVGLNINMTHKEAADLTAKDEDPMGIRYGTLRPDDGTELDIEPIKTKIIRKIMENLTKLFEGGVDAVETFIPNIRRSLACVGEEVEHEEDGVRIKRVLEGITDTGYLQLEGMEPTPAGRLRPII